MKYLKISNKGILAIDNLVDIASSTKRFKYIINEQNLSLALEDKVISQEEKNKIEDAYLNNVFLKDKELEIALTSFINTSNISTLQKYFRNKNIGKFGTGLKQAYCYFLRESIDFKVFAGLNNFKIYKSKKLSAGLMSDFVTIDGNITSLNVAFGIDDYNLGMSISEIWTNALDEGEAKLEIVEEKDIKGEESKTCFYLQFTPEVEAFYNKWDEYFSFNRKDSIYKDGEEDEDGVEIFANPDGSLFEKTIIYRRGIQVYTYNRPSIFHYRIDSLKITGSRIVKDRWDLDNKILNILAHKAPEKAVRDLIEGLDKYEDCYETTLSWDSWAFVRLSKNWSKALEGTSVVEKNKETFYKTSIENTENKVVKLPSTLADKIIENKSASHVNGDFSSKGRDGILLREEDLDDEQKKYLDKIREMVDLYIPDKAFNDIQLYESNNGLLITTYKNDIYIAYNDNRRLDVYYLLIDILTENHLFKKYGEDHCDVYRPDINKELSEVALTYYNEDFKKLKEEPQISTQEEASTEEDLPF
jgi:hypothetical protein